MGWGNIYKRRMKVFTLALVIYLDYKALQQRDKWTRKSKKAALWQKAHERNARRVLNLMVELEGLWVKLGQYLSTRADVLPQAYISLLKQLQDSLPPRPLEEVCQTIQKELGKSMEELFLNFVEVPLATASTILAICLNPLLERNRILWNVELNYVNAGFCSIIRSWRFGYIEAIESSGWQYDNRAVGGINLELTLVI